MSRTSARTACRPIIKDSNYKGAGKIATGLVSKYAHDYPEHYVEQEYMPHKAVYYEPTLQGYWS